jgi:carboxypeptidase C (cathepsin A)
LYIYGELFIFFITKQLYYMKRHLSLFLMIFLAISINAQERSLEPDKEISTTENTVTIKGVKVDYTATVGTIPVWDNEGKKSPTYNTLTTRGKMW